MKIDYHLHTSTSPDSINSVLDIVRKANEQGIQEICITNHHEYRDIENGTFGFALTDEKLANLEKEIEKARSLFPDVIIKTGVELGCYEHHQEGLNQFVDQYPFDFVLGSVHFVYEYTVAAESEIPIPVPELRRVYEEYFRLLIHAMENGNIDVVGHLDIPRKMYDLDFELYREYVDECLNVMKRCDVGFELNAGGFRRRLKEPYPSVRVLQMAREKGIEKLTIGSDAHAPDEVGAFLNEGRELLEQVGFRYICTFDKRTAKYHPL